MKKLRWCCVLLLNTFFLSLVFNVTAATSEESILSFISEVTVLPNATLQVKETIVVKAEGQQIRHGIYRDFPLSYQDQYGSRYKVKFKLHDVYKNGTPSEYTTEGITGGIRIKIGSKNTILQPNVYSYSISYDVTRELGFFNDHDELYWNVTGNGWVFPIKKADAFVRLPTTVPDGSVQLYGYTGVQGSKEQSFIAGKKEPQVFYFSSTRELKAHEGLTIVTSWPKGYVHEPTDKEKILFFINDNLDLTIGIIGLFVLFIYYYNCWSLVGRDPPKDTIVPIFRAPSDISPADARYIINMSFDDKVFTAAIINMAVKGYITIQERIGSYLLYRTSNDAAALTTEEKIIAEELFNGIGSIEVTQSSDSFMLASKNLSAALKDKHVGVNFLLNRKYLVTGIILSLLTVVATLLFQESQSRESSIFFAIWLSIWNLGVAACVSATLATWRKVIKGDSGNNGMTQAIILTLVSCPFIAADVMGVMELFRQGGGAIAVVIIGAVLISMIFAELLKAPTIAGQKILEQLEGFKMFLSATEEDRFEKSEAPPKTPEVFEQFLPFALALGVEKQWADSFSNEISTAMQSSSSRRPYSPSWYRGHHFNSLTDFSSTLTSSFSTAISSSTTPPGSSSGSSGGGGSGGGGGGGGGGGW